MPNPSDPQAFNRYAYAYNSPLRYIDPSGHASVCGFSYSDPDCPPVAPKTTTVSSGGKTGGGGGTSVSGGGGGNDGAEWEIRGCKDLGIAASNCDTAVNALTGITISVDNVAAIVSLAEAGVADLLILGAATVLITQPETAPVDIVTAIEADVFIATLGGTIENNLGWFSLATTGVTDILSGNTYLSNEGLFLGKDTVVATRNTILGLIPESNLDLVVSSSQLKYDMDRLNGVKPGGSINITDFGTMFDQIFWYDSPLQDVITGLTSWKQDMLNP